MNTLVYDLEQQAIKYTDSKVPPNHRYNDIYYEIIRKKLTELIIQECIQICNSRVGNSDYNTGRMHCASDIKEHFGIE